MWFIVNNVSKVFLPSPLINVTNNSLTVNLVSFNLVTWDEIVEEMYIYFNFT